MQVFSLRTLAVLLAFSANAARGASSDFVGTWVNTNSRTNGIVKIVVDRQKHLRAFGACAPNPCDYGLVDLATYGLNVTDTNHLLGSARYVLSFKEVELTLKLAGNNVLRVEDYNKFTDSSARQNYWMSATFRKVSALSIVGE